MPADSGAQPAVAAPASDSATPLPASGVPAGPPATLLPIGTAPALWPGDTLRPAALALDDAGHPVPGVRVHWESSDPTVMEVDSGRLALARAPGDVTLNAYAGAAQGALHLTVLPRIRGRVLPLDATPRAVAIVVRAPGLGDTTLAAPDARFDARFARMMGDSAAVVIRASGYSPALLRVSREESGTPLLVALVPRTWTIRGGSYDGRAVAIDPAAALRRSGAGSFLRIFRSPRVMGTRVVGWLPSAYPIPLALRREAGYPGLTSTDSVTVWAIIRQLERDAGVTLFRPAPRGPGDVPGVTVGIDPSIGSSGLTFAGWSVGGTISGATVNVRSESLLGDSHVLTHELLHALGIGHTTAWRSVMRPGGGEIARATEEDVAYLQLLLRLRAAQESGAPFGLAEAAARGAP